MKDDDLGQVLVLYKGKRDLIIPLLQQIQAKYGYISAEMVLAIARNLKLSESEIFGIATFYAQFKFAPTGRNIVQVCRGTACHVRGADEILSELERHLGIKAGETTDDFEYTLESIACFGSCALAPVMVVNQTVYGRMTPSKAKNILTGKE